MKGFIVYSTYRNHHEKTYVYHIGRLENGQSFVAIQQKDPYFYIKTKEVKKARKVKKDLNIEPTKYTNFAKEPVSKVILQDPKEVPSIRKIFEEEKIVCYEADIRFTQRCLIDEGISATIDLEGDYEPAQEIDRIYKDPQIKPAAYKEPKLNVLSFDIETSADTQELFCIGIYSEKEKVVLLKAEKKYKNAESYHTEEELLERFIQKIKEIDPDIITGWNCIDFDLVFLKKCHQKNRVPFTYGRDNTPNKLRIEHEFFRDSKAEIQGRVVLDGMHLMKSSFIKLDDYKLNTAAKTVLKDSKLIESTSRWQEIERLYKEEPQKLIDYNLKDAELAYKIIEKANALKLAITRSKITGMPLDRVNASIASLDALYLKEAKKRGIVVPSAIVTERQERILGGYVKSPEPGIYENIIVLDFKSLYPSIMRTFNIDPLTYTKQEKGTIRAPNGAHFTHEPGILPQILTEIWQQRDEARKQKDELTRYALKILMNSFFGVLASPNCRFYSLEIANAITHFGQYLIKQTAEKIEKAGYQVIYGDTDSLFIKTNTKSSQEAEKIGKKLAKDINDYYKEHITKEYQSKSYLELEYEKCYTKCIMPKVRGAQAGAKKRYAGLIKKEGKEEIEFVGLEFVRSDWTQAAKNFQEELLNKIFHNQEVDKFIQRFVKDLKNGKMDKNLIYQKSLRKEVDEYTRTTPPHVKAARKLKTRDSNVIEYVITTDGPEPIQEIKHAIDYEHYIQKQIKPLADQILGFYNVKFEDIMKGTTQTTLFGH